MQVKLYLPPATHERLRAASADTGRSMSVIVNFLIDRYMEPSLPLLRLPAADDPRVAGVVSAPSLYGDEIGTPEADEADDEFLD